MEKPNFRIKKSDLCVIKYFRRVTSFINSKASSYADTYTVSYILISYKLLRIFLYFYLDNFIDEN